MHLNGNTSLTATAAVCGRPLLSRGSFLGAWITSGTAFAAIVVADLKKDGNVDVITVNTGYVLVGFDKENGALTLSLFLTGRSLARQVVVGDLDNDNYSDLVAGASNEVSLWRNARDGTLS